VRGLKSLGTRDVEYTIQECACTLEILEQEQNRHSKFNALAAIFSRAVANVKIVASLRVN